MNYVASYLYNIDNEIQEESVYYSLIFLGLGAFFGGPIFPITYSLLGFKKNWI